MLRNIKLIDGPAMSTLPLPTLNLARTIFGARTEQATPTCSDELQGVVFVSRSEKQRTEPMGGGDQPDGTEPFRPVEEKLALVLLHRDSRTPASEAAAAQTRLTVVGVEKRDAELAETFKDIGSDGADIAHIADWVSLRWGVTDLASR